MKKVIELRNLKIQRGGFQLGPINYCFDNEKIELILGENGSGKTSLLKAILGRIALLEGEISKPSPMASLGTEPFLFENWTTQDFYHWYKKLSGREEDSKLASFFDKAYFKGLLHQKISHLSSGRMRAFELFCTLSLDFPVYLFDEIFAHLDGKRRELFTEILLEKRKVSKSLIILSGHSRADFPFPSEFIRSLELSK